MQPLSPASITSEEQIYIDKLIASHRGRPGALLGILEATQERNRYKYLPLDTLRYIASRMEMPLARIYSVATFYALFNLDPQGDNTICVCRGTACHTRGSRNLLARSCLELGLGLSTTTVEEQRGRQVSLTTPDRKFTVRTVACFGQCALAPVVEVNHRICGHVNERTLQREIETIRAGERIMPRIQDIGAFNAVREAGLAKLVPPVPRIAIGMGTCGRGNGAEGLYHAFAEAIERSGHDVVLRQRRLLRRLLSGAAGQRPPARRPARHARTRAGARRRPHSSRHFHRQSSRPTSSTARSKSGTTSPRTFKYGQGYPEVPSWNEVPFFKGQKKIVLRNCGLINPDDIEEYIAVGGYQALYKVLIDGRPDAVIEQIKAVQLRGRGGAGFLTGNKWEFLAKAKAEPKYIICNADEGDPGAYMNRNEIEGDPHSLLEGMIIGAYVMGATEGIIYVRAEYPLAVHRLNRAIEQAREYGLLGENILDRGFNFDIELVQGAGAFVCGEETALIASLEGYAGRPHPRPPFPAQKGLWGKPTNINNVETWCNIAPIVSRGPAWFTETGSAKSPGTKVFSLVGKIQNTGLVEMPLGTPLKTFIYDIGEGARRRPPRQGRADRRPFRRLHPARNVRHARRLRKPRAARLHHGLGRHGGDGRRQLHGRRRPLLRRIHALRILRQMRPVPRRPQQGAAHPEPHHRRRGHRRTT